MAADIIVVNTIGGDEGTGSRYTAAIKENRYLARLPTKTYTVLGPRKYLRRHREPPSPRPAAPRDLLRVEGRAGWWGQEGTWLEAEARPGHARPRDTPDL